MSPPLISLNKISLMSRGRISKLEQLKTKAEFRRKENLTIVSAASLVDLGFQQKLQLNRELLSLLCRMSNHVSQASGS